MRMSCIGVELDPTYIEVARRRIASVAAPSTDADQLVTRSKRSAPRVSFGQLVEAQYISIGQKLFSHDRRYAAVVKADSCLLWGNATGSIHKIAALAQGRAAFNGWKYWHVEDETGTLISIDVLRERFRAANGLE
jgi:site-specific DNA-methyltransferase (adenine-specific)/modification methylase